MTRQEIFDFVAKKMFAQGEPSYRHDNQNYSIGSCAYRIRKSDGTVLKCAVGHLIPDDQYDDTIEMLAASDPYVMKRLPVEKDDGDFLDALQHAHDSTVLEQVSMREREVKWTDLFKENLRKLAEEFNLSTKVLEE